MKTVLYWFSGTGNSLMIAKTIAAELGGAEMVPMLRADRAADVVAERVGLVFPVYAFGPPGAVLRFARAVAIPAGAYVFSVATMGGLAGGTHRRLRAVLRRRGIELAGGWSVIMPGNYTPMYGAEPAGKIEKTLAKVPARVGEIAAAVNRGERGRIEDSVPPFNWVGALANRAGLSRFRGADRKFIVQSQCTHCGLCARVCPVENIRMENGTPVWQHRCEQCMACLQWCPVEAIQFGKATVGRRRYHHPDCKAADVCLRN